MARVPKNKVKGAKESEVLRSLCEYLTIKRHFFWRQNTAPIFHDGRFFAMPKYALRGVPDIILIDSTGHFVGIEAKGRNGKLSPDQLEFQRRCKEVGAEYIIARSVDDLVENGL